MTLFWCIMTIATLASFYFTAANHALFDYSSSKLSDLLAGTRREKWIERLDNQRNALLLETSLLRTAANLTIFVAMLWLFRDAVEENWWNGTMVALVCAAAIVVIFGVAVPLSWARYCAESLLAYTLGFLLTISILLRPFMILLHVFDPLVRRLLGVPDPMEEDTAPAEQEILDAVTEGRKSGFMNDAQKMMIEAVVEFPATTVDQIMTPRTDIEGMPVDATLHEVKRFISEAGHSRVPVFDGDLDHIVGVLYAKDLIPMLGHQDTINGFDLRKLVRNAVLVPETKTLSDLLTQLREMKVHIAIVLDEYGGTAGLVTIEDIVEEIFGEIQDEYEPPDEEEPTVERVDDHTWEAHGRVYIDDLNQVIGSDLPDEEDYDTLAGFVLAKLGRIPDTGERFAHNGLTFTILDAERTRVNKIRIESHEPASTDDLQ